MLYKKDNLTVSQRKILGKGYSSDIYHPHFSHLHSLPNDDAFYEDEQEQTYEEFVDMGKRPPNEEGTGRFKLTKKRDRLGCVFLVNQEKDKIDQSLRVQREQICQYHEAFFGMKTDLIEFDQEIFDTDSGTIHIGEYIYELTMLPKKKKKRKKSEMNCYYIEVFSLFDALESLAAEPYFSLVLFIDHPLCEEDEDSEDGFQVVCGRACGNRVSCVSLTECSNLKDVLCVSLHELLHTMGFDHCNSWQCLMNASGNDSWLFLSPVNLRKLKNFHRIEDSDISFLYERYERLLILIERFQQDPNLKDLFVREENWLREKISIYTRLLPLCK